MSLYFVSGQNFIYIHVYNLCRLITTKVVLWNCLHPLGDRISSISDSVSSSDDLSGRVLKELVIALKKWKSHEMKFVKRDCLWILSIRSINTKNSMDALTSMLDSIF